MMSAVLILTRRQSPFRIQSLIIDFTQIRTITNCHPGYKNLIADPRKQNNDYNNISRSSTVFQRTFNTTNYTSSRLLKQWKPSARKENTRLTEVITIYEKLTKSRDKGGDEDIFRLSMTRRDRQNLPTETVEESATVLDFSKFRDIQNEDYLYFSSATGLIQAQSLKSLRWNKTSEVKQAEDPPLDQNQDFSDFISNSKQFCLCVVNPTEIDYDFLKTKLHVHDLTLRDIREQNTEEKVEVFKNYTFISFKVYLDAGENQTDPLPRGRKEDLNILMFPESESAIILHYGERWTGFKDMLGFLNLLCTYGDSSLTPDWVLFSIIIELAQDAKFSVNQLEPSILNLKLTKPSQHQDQGTEVNNNNDITNSATDLSSVLTKNFANEFEIYKINRFIKPKIKVLKELQVKGHSRFSPKVLSLLSGTRREFEEIGEALGHFNHILERSQDTCLTLANVKQSEEANEMGRMMKRISEVALLFLPLQAVAGLLGMNVKIPLQDMDSTGPFWAIMATSSVLVIVLYRFSQRAPKQIASRTKAFALKPNINASSSNPSQKQSI